MKFHIHKYTKWSEPYKVKTATSNWYWDMQKRTCTICNKIQERTI